MVSKLFITVCILFLMMECLVESHQIPSESESVLLHRQKRSKELVEKIKKLVLSPFGGASKTSPDDSTEKDSEASGTSHSYSYKGKEDDKHSKKHSEHGGDEGHHHDEGHFDSSKLIKSTLHTLFELFKAIGGASTAISGKLIKISGYGVSYGGKLISASGDPITSLGKKIALKATLLPPDKTHSHDDDFSSHTANELIEFNHPHDATGYLPESPIIQYGPMLNGFDNQFAGFHEPVFQYGPQWPISHIHKRKSKSK